MRKILFVLLFLVATNAAFADNVKVQLDSSDGTSSFIVADTLSSQVFAVNSDGNATVVNNAWAGLGVNAGKMQFMDVAGTQDDIGFLNCNVGVGTTSPSWLLHILSGSTDVQITVQGSDAQGSAMAVYRTVTDDFVWAINRIADTQDLKFFVGPSFVTALNMQTLTGNIGIGTTYGNTLVNIGGDITLLKGADIRPDSNATNALNIANSAGTDFVTFDTTNTRVGILTATPATALDVRGDITLGSGSDIRPSANSTKAIDIANATGTDFVTFNTTNSRMGIGVGGTIPERTMVIYSSNTLTGTAGTAIVGLKRTTDNLGWSQYMNSGPGSLVIREYTNTAWSAGTDRVTFENGGNVGIGTTNPANTLDVVGNFCLGNTAAGSNATRTLVLVNGISPPIVSVDSVQLYAEDVSASSELFVLDESGFATRKSPHDPITGEWVFYSKNIKTGRVVRVEMEKLIKIVEKASGKRFMTERWE